MELAQRGARQWAEGDVGGEHVEQQHVLDPLDHALHHLPHMHMQVHMCTWCSAHAHAVHTCTVHVYMHQFAPVASCTHALTLASKASSGSRCSRSSAQRCVTMAVTK